MAIVTRPFALDFAGVYLNIPPDFPDSIRQEWEAEEQEQFGAHWPAAQKIPASSTGSIEVKSRTRGNEARPSE